MSIKNAILLRARLAFFGILIIALAIVFRIFYIQYFDGNRWEKVAEDYGLQYRTTPAIRGSIYAANGELLATSVPLYKVSIDPTIIPENIFKKDIDSLCILLSQYFDDATPAQYKRKIMRARQQGKRYLILNNELINYKAKKDMEAFPIFREGQLKGGVLFEKIHHRSYPYDQLAERTVGYINERDEGVVGLEKSFENQLRGKDGQALYQKIAGGDWKPISNFSEVKPQDGYDIYTTIDVATQEIVTEILHESLIKLKAEYGTVIVMDVKTGYIKAMVNLGLNDDGNYVEKYNYAIGDQGSTEPGSTFKLFSMVALLEDSDLELIDSIETGGGTFRYSDRVMRDPKYGGYGKITVQQTIEQSSNIGVSRLVTKHFGNQPARYIEYMQRFGITRPFGFQVIGEAKPYVKHPSNRDWSGVTLPWMSIGYEVKLAPIHTLAFYNAIANNGMMMKPQVVSEIRKANNLIERFNPTIINPKICSDTTLAKVNVMLEGVVRRGTARGIYTRQYKIAGKTGTSQKIRNGRYIKEYYTSFVGFFPADAPRYSCIVVIDQPKTGKRSGGTTAAPIFRQIADRLYVRDLEMQKTIANIDQSSGFQVKLPANNVSYFEDVAVIMRTLSIPSTFQEDAIWVKPVPRTLQIEWQEQKIVEEAVPNVIGMTLRDAVYLLENQGLKVYYEGGGKVKSQSLMPGSAIPSNKRIRLYLE